MQSLRDLKKGSFFRTVVCFAALLSLSSCGIDFGSGKVPPEQWPAAKTYHLSLCPDITPTEYVYVDAIDIFQVSDGWAGDNLLLVDNKVEVKPRFLVDPYSSSFVGYTDLEWTYAETDKMGENASDGYSFKLEDLLSVQPGQVIHKEISSAYSLKDKATQWPLDLSIDFTVAKINFDGARDAVECDVTCKTVDSFFLYSADEPVFKRQCDFLCNNGFAGGYPAQDCKQNCDNITEESEASKNIVGTVNFECKFSNVSGQPPNVEALRKTFSIDPNTGKATLVP